MRFHAVLGLVLCGLAAAFICGCSSREEHAPKREVLIGLNPSERSQGAKQNADILATMISRNIGMPVRIFVAQDYSGLVEAMRGRSVDFAFLPPLSYVFAERIADARVLLKAERKGRPYYYGCIVVNADSSFRTLADLHGRSIGWVDPTSTSGHIFPKAALIAAGSNPDSLFGRQRFAGGHDAVLLAVLNGTLDAGATFANDTSGVDGSWTQLGDGRFAGKIRPIFYSPPIPGDNLSATGYMVDHHPEIVAAVTAAVRGLTADSAGQALMRRMYHVDAMIPATAADYEPVRKAAQLLKLDIQGNIGGDTSSAERRESNARREEDLRDDTLFSILFFGVAGIVGLGWLFLRGRREHARPSTAVVEDAPVIATDRSAIDPAVLYAIRGLSVNFRDRGGSVITALRNVDLDIRRGEFIAVIGLSGAGKSTLLRCLNGMNRPSAGSILFNGEDLTRVDGARLRALRARIGFIFQQFNLVRNISALRNVLTGRLAQVSRLRSILGLYPSADMEIARRYLREVGLADKMKSRAGDLSGGQQQRVAIARALAQQPAVILADEPMASLDPKLAEVVLQLLRRFNREEGITVLVNLHVLQLAREYADRMIALRGGEIVFDGRPETLTPEIVEGIYRTDAVAVDRM